MPCSRWLRPATTVASSSSVFSREAARRIGSAALNSRMASAFLPARISPTARIPRAEAASKCFSPTRAISRFNSDCAASRPACVCPEANMALMREPFSSSTSRRRGSHFAIALSSSA